MATVSTAERGNILKLVAGMFNAAPGAAYLQEFSEAFAAMGRDYGALARALGQTAAFKGLYPPQQGADAFTTQFLGTLGLQMKLEAQTWVKAQLAAGKPHWQVMVEALAAIVETSDPGYASARQLLEKKAAVAEYFSGAMGSSSDSLEHLQAVIGTVTASADVSSPTALRALVDAGLAGLNPNPHPDPGPDPHPDPDPSPGIQIVEFAPPQDNPLTLQHFAAGTQLRISGRNQTLTDSNRDQYTGAITLDAPRGEELAITLDNTARVDGRLAVHALSLRDNPQDPTDTSAVRTLRIVSNGQRDTHNAVFNLGAESVGQLLLSGTQDLALDMWDAAALPQQSWTLDASGLNGKLKFTVFAPTVNRLDASPVASTWKGGASTADELSFFLGELNITQGTRISGFETLRFTDAATVDARATAGVQHWISDWGRGMKLLHLSSQASVQISEGRNDGEAQQFHTDQGGANATLDILMKGSSAQVQEIATSGFGTVRIKLDSNEPNQGKAFKLDLSKTAVDVQMNPLEPLQLNHAQAQDVEQSHWINTKLSQLIVTGGQGLVNGAVTDTLDLNQLSRTLKLLDVSGYQGHVSLSVQWPFVNTIAGVTHTSGNTTVKIGGYGLHATDFAHGFAGMNGVTTFEFTRDALSKQAGFSWDIANFAGIKEMHSSMGNLTVLDLRGLGVHGLQELKLAQTAGDTVITDESGQKNFKIVLSGQSAADLGLENFIFAP